MSDVSERAEAMLAKIAPGPWELTPPDPAGFPGDYWSIGTRADGLLERVNVSCPNPHAHPGLATAEADARFIAAAPDLVAGLLAERDAALSEYESYRAFISECGSDEGAYCEGWAHGYELAHHRLDKYLDERGVESVAELVDALQAKIDAARAICDLYPGMARIFALDDALGEQ